MRWSGGTTNFLDWDFSAGGLLRLLYEPLCLCDGGECEYQSRVYYTPTQDDWDLLKPMFDEVTDPTMERARMQIALAHFRQVTGTGKYGPYDIDEAANNTVYMILLWDSGLLKFHVPLTPIYMWLIFRGDYHLGAFKDVTTFEDWVVDPMLMYGMCPAKSWH